MDNIQVVKSELRLREWAERISECQTSGMTVSAWCASQEINTKTYYYWLRKVRARAIEANPSLAPASLPAVNEPAEIQFKKLEVQPPVTGFQPAVIVRLPSATLEINNGVDQSTVEAVLLALKSLC